MQLILVRHGYDDFHLGESSIGLCEARKAGKCIGELLDGRHVPVVVSSPLARARETAKVIAAELRLGGVIVSDELAEDAPPCGNRFSVLATGTTMPVYVTHLPVIERTVRGLTVLGAEMLSLRTGEVVLVDQDARTVESLTATRYSQDL